MAHGLWTVPPYGRLLADHKASTTLRVAHTAYNLDSEVCGFSGVKWVLLGLTKTRRANHRVLNKAHSAVVEGECAVASLGAGGRVPTRVSQRLSL